MIKIGRVICKHCSADYYIEPKYKITKCPFCRIPIILKYSIVELGNVSDDEILKLKNINKFVEIEDTTDCLDRYKLTYHICSKCNKGYYIDPSIDISVCDFCNSVCNISSSLSEDDMKYSEEIKKIKDKDLQK